MSAAEEYNQAIHLGQAGKYQEAVDILRKILPDFEKYYQTTGEFDFLMMCLASLASFSSRLPDYDAAIEDTNRVIEFAKSVGDDQRVQMFSVNLTKLYLFKGIAICAHQFGDWSTSKKNYAIALDIAPLNTSEEEIQSLKVFMQMAERKEKPDNFHFLNEKA
jgi:tetratricopeptide (TPR) repeat protein